MASPPTQKGWPRCTATRSWSMATTSRGGSAARARPAVSVDPRRGPVDDAVMVQWTRGAAGPWAVDGLVVAPGPAAHVGRLPPSPGRLNRRVLVHRGL